MDVEKITQRAKDNMASRRSRATREPGAIFDHGRRTAQIAMKLQDRLDATVDRDILFTGALLHDIGKGREPHNEIGANIVAELFEDLCEPDELESVCEIIRDHNQRLRSGECSMAARIVQDADILDKVGPISPWLAFYWSATRDRTIDDTLAYLHSDENERYHTRMRNLLNFDVSTGIFDQRARFENEFFAEFERVQREGL